MKVCKKWTTDQESILRRNYLLDDDDIASLVNQCGPYRTSGAVAGMRRKLRLIRPSQRGMNSYANDAQRGWPVMVGDPEVRDRRFVRLALQEGLRLGLIRKPLVRFSMAVPHVS